ncbi:MAG: hypothetical protein QOI09_1949, partial [Chloroflexota bacterium]|nr:hypothetical protein [Chloroflexota bacterium]
ERADVQQPIADPPQRIGNGHDPERYGNTQNDPQERLAAWTDESRSGRHWATSAECCLALGPRAASIVPVQVSIQPGMQWARMDAQALDTAFVGEFEDMLATVDFK